VVQPRKGIATGNQFWIADEAAGLLEGDGSRFEGYKPNSPAGVVLGQMVAYNGTLYAAAGSVNDSWNYQFNPSGVMRFREGYWESYNLYGYRALDSLLDFITVAIDPRDESIWAGSYGGGLLHVAPNNQLQIYKRNGTLQEAVGDPGSFRVSGLAFDADNNLWVSNFGSNRQLHVRKSDGTWRAFAVPFTLSFNAVSQILIDDAAQKWIVSPLGNGLLVFNDNNSIDNTSDDKWRIYRFGQGQGNLPSNDVRCVAKDKSGFIWVGTSDGVAVIQCPQDAFATGCEAVLPIIKAGNFASFLFKGKFVNSIAVDGADRKWIASDDGVWLVSRDGDQVLEHFTEMNSPLPSNDVRSVAIDGQTGEVYIATSKGLVSYRAGATEAAETKDKILVFPNPVPPGYNGSIGIRGLPENSVVKIIEPAGRLVYQTRSLGGQAIWNGRDYKGGQASSGVYLVMAVSDDKSEKVVAKIVFIAK
jgi:ligand-binding sensor domain-containing protein